MRPYNGQADHPIYIAVKARGVTIREAARDMGVPLYSINKILRGDIVTDLDRATKIANWIGVPVEDFVIGQTAAATDKFATALAELQGI